MKMRLAALLLTLTVAACTGTPTQSTQVVDDRPRLAFETESLPKDISDYLLVIDGVGYGSLGQYLAGENALRLVSGPHVIEVTKDDQTVFRQSVVLGENTTRIVRVAPHE